MDGRRRPPQGLRGPVRGIGYVVLLAGMVLVTGWTIATLLRVVMT